MKRVGISDFKARCIGLIKEAHRSGEPLVVTRRGQPLVRVEPILGTRDGRRLGALRDRMRIDDDIDRVGFDQDWEMLVD